MSTTPARNQQNLGPGGPKYPPDLPQTRSSLETIENLSALGKFVQPALSTGITRTESLAITRGVMMERYLGQSADEDSVVVFGRSQISRLEFPQE